MEEKKDIFNDGKEFFVNKVMGAFKNMKKKASAKVENKSNDAVAATLEAAPTMDIVAFQRDFLKKTFDKLKSIATNTAVFPQRYLNVYIADEDMFDWAENNAIAEKLNDFIEERLARLKEVRLHPGTPTEGMATTEVMEGISITVTAKLPAPPPPKPRTAVISMCYEESICCINGGPLELTPQQGEVWNIGWGRTTEVKGRPRVNHIALEYKEPDKHNEDEYMISRIHAHIRYADKFYFLHVEERGTRQAEKRTKIVRDGEEIELTDIKVGKALRDGDIIRLNNEYLLFNLK